MKLCAVHIVLVCVVLRGTAGLVLHSEGVSFVDDVLFLANAAGSMLPAKKLWAQLTNHIVQSAIRSCELVPPSLRNTLQVDTSQIKMVYYNSTGSKVFRISEAAKALFYNGDFQPNLPTYIYIHGWRNTPLDESSQGVIKSLLQKKNINVLAVDARHLFDGTYMKSVRNVAPVGEMLYKFLKRLISKGVQANKITLIGYSLGAHIAGKAGTLLKSVDKLKLVRITALDPAGPCFTGNSSERLNRHSATYVEVIHTSPGTLGLVDAIGHADFYVNGVTGNQPDCTRASVRISCSHSKSWKMYANSVAKPGIFIAQKCDSWSDLVGGRCKGSFAVMGFGSNINNRGLFLWSSNSVKGKKQRY